jgi:(R,R)-butanediol dehydrogenase / meso-butanediol dehydrogenase / diacetyl reductase
VTAAFYEAPGRFVLGMSAPIEPGPGEVRLEVAYCGVCGTDLHIAQGHMDHRVRAPQVIGHEMSGVVAEVGEGVDVVSVGDRVVVRPLDTRGETPADKGVTHICRELRFLGIDTPGAFQQSWTVPAFTLHPLPATVDLRLGALVEPLAVACHDVTRAALVSGESAVVLGGGPIGLLVALVARERGAYVLVSEPNPFRANLAAELGFDVVGPSNDLRARVLEGTDGAGADVVFEVSGAAVAAETMTELACLRGRIVVVAIHPDPPPVRLFDFFWKELTMVGARVYEPADYEAAITPLAAGTLSLDRLVTAVEPLAALPGLFETLQSRPDTMKILVDCRA